MHFGLLARIIRTRMLISVFDGTVFQPCLTLLKFNLGTLLTDKHTSPLGCNTNNHKPDVQAGKNIQLKTIQMTNKHSNPT